jgi:ATP-dependent DNA helicase PIF1
LALRDPATLPDAVEALSDLVSRNSEDERSVILATTNAVADGVNTTRLQALAGQVRVFNGQVSGDYANSELPVPRTIRLKVGARVMVAANDRAEPRRYVNGTMGTIRVIHDGQVQLERDDGVDVWIEPYVWQRIEPQWHDERKEIVMVPVATYTQIPLKLGWAFTVHKAQGLTFDRVHIKPGNGFFCSGHAYVAVTRCRTSAGLSCDRPFTVGDFHWDEDVRGFLARLGP